MDEVITWNLVSDQLPDEGMVVLLSVPDASWRYVDGSRVTHQVIAWAEMPAGVPNVERTKRLAFAADCFDCGLDLWP